MLPACFVPYNDSMQKKPDPIPLTQDTYTQLRADQKRYLQEESEVLVRLQAAREMGDLSENGAYKYAKFELGKVRRELRRINHLLRYGQVIQKTQTETVDIGITVTLKRGDIQVEYLIVSHHESNPLKGKLSLESPLGQALKDKRVGDTVVLSLPDGEVSHTIVAIN